MEIPEKILVIRFSSLGDLILTSGTIRNLRNSFPQAEIILTTKAEYDAIAQLVIGVSRAILLPTGSLIAFLKYILCLKKEHFDLVIDLHNNLRSRIIRDLCGFKEVIVYDSERKRRKTYLKAGDKHPPFKHTVDLYNATIKTISSNTLYNKPELDKTKINRNSNSPTVGIVTSTKHKAKRWPSEYFIALSNDLLLKGLQLIIICDESDDTSYEALRHSSAVKIHSRPTLDKLIDLIYNCDQVISGDTGPMHIAVAISIPVIAIFGPTHPALGFYPLGSKDRLISIFAECSPCSLHGEKPCYQPRRFCMEDLKPEMVLNEVYETLKASK